MQTQKRLWFQSLISKMTTFRAKHKNFQKSRKISSLGKVLAQVSAPSSIRKGLAAPLIGFFLLTASLFTASHQAHAGPAIVFDNKSDLILYAEEADRLWHPASLTKLMTSYLVFEAIKANKLSMESELYNSKYARSQPPSKIGLPLGAKIKVKDAIEILIVKSANDVAVMFAEKIGGSVPRFAKMMNNTAARLGMRSSNFINPHGLPHSGQVTTARDMALLARALIRDFPEYNYLYSIGSVKLGKRRMRSHNDLLRTYKGADGMKTGFICDSGFNVVASATRDGRRIIAVVLGSKSTTARRKRATKLLDHGFQNYWWKTLFPFSLATIDNSTVNRSPGNMRGIVCNRGPAKKRVYKKKRSSKKKYKKKRVKKKSVKRKVKKKPIKKKK